MARTFAGFDWDDGNWPKCGKHGVSLAEIEMVLSGQPAILPDLEHSQQETRFLAIGRTQEGRHLFICFTIRERQGDHYVRPISARYMRQREVDSYEKQNP